MKNTVTYEKALKNMSAKMKENEQNALDLLDLAARLTDQQRTNTIASAQVYATLALSYATLYAGM